MNIRETLQFMCYLFCVVTTCVIIFIAVYAALFSQAFALDYRDLFRVLSVALASALPTLLFIRKDTASPRALTARRGAHFVLTAGGVFTLLARYGWLDGAYAAGIALLFLAVYIGAHIVLRGRAKKLAARLNERINAFHRAENATHRDTR